MPLTLVGKKFKVTVTGDGTGNSVFLDADHFNEDSFIDGRPVSVSASGKLLSDGSPFGVSSALHDGGRILELFFSTSPSSPVEVTVQFNYVVVDTLPTQG